MPLDDPTGPEGSSCIWSSGFSRMTPWPSSCCNLSRLGRASCDFPLLLLACVSAGCSIRFSKRQKYSISQTPIETQAITIMPMPVLIPPQAPRLRPVGLASAKPFGSVPLSVLLQMSLWITPSRSCATSFEQLKSFSYVSMIPRRWMPLTLVNMVNIGKMVFERQKVDNTLR